MSQSELSRLAELAESDPAAVDSWLGDAPQTVVDAIRDRAWSVIARPEQREPEGDWLIWLILTGRGWGKTRSGAEWTIERAERLARQTGDEIRWALVGRDFSDVRDTMVEGESGILRSLAPSQLHGNSIDDAWNRSLGELRLSCGARLRAFSSERPSRLRGPQHHGAWIDEPATLRDADRGLRHDTTLANLLLGLRLRPDPRCCITGTPRRVALILELLDDDAVHVTSGSTYDNLANLAPSYRERIIDRYEGTRLGRQELHAELLDDVGELFQRDWFQIVDDVPSGLVQVRAWDLAATEPTESNPDPGWTAGALVGLDRATGVKTVLHIARFRELPGAVEERIVELGREDALRVVGIEQEPGSAGKAQVAHYAKRLGGISRVEAIRPTGAKATRAEVVAADAERGRVRLLRGDWNLALLDELEAFPGAGMHDDQVDALAHAWELLARRERRGVRSAAGNRAVTQSTIRELSGTRR
jgi:predicted phage terminase large subunit-like protein